MITFLTSSPCLSYAGDLNPVNGFVDELHRVLPNPLRALFVCSCGYSYGLTDQYARDMKESFELAGFVFTAYEVLDDRTADSAQAMIDRADFIILAGGHVPTQQVFFNKVGLRHKIAGYEGVVMGISAGSMNAADIVYIQPELDGEDANPDFVRFAPGLDLTEVNILPHLQMVRNNILDGRRLIDDISVGDSIGHCFYALPDGSYLYGENGREELRGEVWRIRDGKMEQISKEGEIVYLS